VQNFAVASRRRKVAERLAVLPTPEGSPPPSISAKLQGTGDRVSWFPSSRSTIRPQETWSNIFASGIITQASDYGVPRPARINTQPRLRG
jgi:hypothetical protein